MSYTNTASTGNTRVNGVWQYATAMRNTPSVTIGNTVNVNGLAPQPRPGSCMFNADSIGTGNADIRDLTADAEL
jgi:hypothetical protein